MENYIHNMSANRIGNAITATYAIEGDKVDIELLIPLDKSVASTDAYIYKDQIKIVNAVVASYKGNPIGLRDACNSLNQYIIEHEMQPITIGYNVTRKMDMINPDNTEIDVYVGINPNIL